MTPRALLAIGFLGIGATMLAITLWLIYHTMAETRIGTALVETGQETQALVVTAERLEHSQCSLSQLFICTPAANIIATMVYQVSGLRYGSEIRLTSEEYEAFAEGQEVFVDLIYLPSAPLEAERSPGARLTAASTPFLQIYVAAAFAITFLAIGGIAALIARKPNASV